MGRLLADTVLAKASKEQISSAVEQLLALKKTYEEQTGQPFDPPKPPAKSESKPAESKAESAEETERTGPSKKELNKLEKKKKKEAYKEGAKTGEEPRQTSESSVPPPEVLELVVSDERSARLCRLVAALTNSPISVSSSTGEPHLPYLSGPRGSVSGAAAIARLIARSAASPLYPADPWLAAQVDQWLDRWVAGTEGRSQLSLRVLETHLASRTYLVGQELTLADLAVADLLEGLHADSLASLPHLTRWTRLISDALPRLPPVKETKEKKKPADDGGVCPPLEDAVEGAVCTRFPPEPSGYLHIGHAKAVLLNQYYAQRYRGRLLVRFDDTNPSKEKEEFEDNILADLATLGVQPDAVSHTSDHFGTCEGMARQLISAGLAYMDDTDQDTMQAERLQHKESRRRNTDVETNLSLFEALLRGDPEAQRYCLRCDSPLIFFTELSRAKIDMNSVNGTLRDPVLYRYNATPHHRTGTKYKAYPTYDFACPVRSDFL